MKKPHIIIFNPDQFRYDGLGHSGNPCAVTPVLDKMVQEDAVSFSHAFCQNPVCTPSRCSFMTGWYPHVRGHRTMYHMLNKDEPMLLKTLKENGYFVWWGGKNDLLPGENSWKPYADVMHRYQGKMDHGTHSNHNGWRGDPEGDNYYSFYAGELKPEATDKYTDGDWGNIYGALEQIENISDEKPVCMYLPIGYPHPPYGVEEPWYSMIDRNKVPPRIPAPGNWEGKPSILKGLYEGQGLQGWSEDRFTELRATYYGMCARVDHQLGMVIQALKDKGIYDDTAIFFFTDHGDFTADYGLVEKTQNTFEDCLTRIPFIIKPPKGIPVKPRSSDAMVELVDFVATVESMTGITSDYTHFGKDLVPLLTGETDELRDAVFCEGGRLNHEVHCSEIQSTSSGNDDGLYSPRMRLQTNMDADYHSKATMCRTADYKYVRRLYEKDELYDLKKDSQELSNVVDDPQYREILLQMKDRMLQFYHETSDVVPHMTNQRNFIAD